MKVSADGFGYFQFQIHRDEESGKILKFSIRNDGEQLKVDVPLVFKWLDNCPGIKKGNNTLYEPVIGLEYCVLVLMLPLLITIDE